MCRCCNTCPFLEENTGKPNPEGHENSKANQDWYSDENLLRIWKEICNGEVLQCHSFDPEAASYGGTNAKGGKRIICLGSLALVFTHINHFGELFEKNRKTAYAKYKKQSEFPMSREALSIYVSYIQFGTTSLLGGLKVPNSIKETRKLRIAWEDELLKAI